MSFVSRETWTPKHLMPKMQIWYHSEIWLLASDSGSCMLLFHETFGAVNIKFGKREQNAQIQEKDEPK